MCKDFLCIFNDYCKDIKFPCTECCGIGKCTLCVSYFDCTQKNKNKDNEEKKEG